MMMAWLTGLLISGGCKVPIQDVNAGFAIAEATWFEGEETLFVFYEVFAEQGIGDPSQVEVTYVTDTEEVPWTPIDAFPTVHQHVPVDCGVDGRCGSTSLAIADEPRDVRLRLRYHRDGALALNAETVFNVVGNGPAHRSRSLVVYGVFDETNQLVQWRSRHQFPNIRNEQATDLGLRRTFTVSDSAYGAGGAANPGNPYLYGGACPGGLQALDFPPLTTDERARFRKERLPIDAGEASIVCARTRVTDATGSFDAAAYARKNPEVRDAFPLLRSPVREATQLPFFLAPCDRTISEEHEALQRQRLLVEGLPPLCTNGAGRPDFVDRLVVTFRDAIEEARPQGDDMVLVIGVHQDEPEVVTALEEALLQVLPGERHRSSPRVAGALVFDSTPRGLEEPALSQTTLWCPSTVSEDALPDASARSCAIVPDTLLNLGPFTFGGLPVLPSRDQYLDFLVDFTERQAGEVLSTEYLVPEFATTSLHVDLGEFGVVTFLNGETIFADADDAFSFCTQEEFLPFMAQSDLLTDPYVAKALAYGCKSGELPAELCLGAEVGVLPIEFLSVWHNQAGETSYRLGLFWQFPFLLRMEYEARVAASVEAVGISIPFGFAAPAEPVLGGETWMQEEFSLAPALTQCRRFCDHPTFDSAGVYNVEGLFRPTYESACYVPDFPAPGETGFPRDP